MILFFFISGYGLYNEYEGKQLEIIYWKKAINKYLFDL